MSYDRLSQTCFSICEKAPNCLKKLGHYVEEFSARQSTAHPHEWHMANIEYGLDKICREEKSAR